MAVSEQTPYKEYTANGSASSFALEFDCDNQDHLIVLIDDIEPVMGTWSLIGGAVVFSTVPANGKKITIQRNTPFRRDGDFQSYDNSFRPGSVNKGFDKTWWKIQELGVADWLLGLKLQKFRDDVNLTALENTLEQAQEIRNETAELAVEVQGNVDQSQTLLGNTTTQANLAQDSANNANTSKDQAQQAVTDANAIKSDMYTALYSFQNGAIKAYPTLAAANADIANIALDVKVEVLESANGGSYYKATAGATTLTKSPYDPLAQAKVDATTKANTAEANAIAHADSFGIEQSNQHEVAFALVDESGKRTWLECDEEGKPTSNSATIIIEKVAPDITQTVLDETGISTESGDIGLSFAIVDESGKRTWLECGEDGAPSTYATQLIRSKLEAPVIKPLKIVTIGDSMTYGAGGDGNPYPSRLRALITAQGKSAEVYNAGVGGESSASIVARQGANPFIVNPCTIPASVSPVTITLRGINGLPQFPLYQGSGNGAADGYGAGLVRYFEGKLNGIAGRISLVQPSAVGNVYTPAADDYYTFTRTTAGLSVEVSRPCAFYLDYFKDKLDAIYIIWIGQNNASDIDRAISDAKAVIHRLQDKKYIVISRPVSSAETTTKSERDAVDSKYFAEFGRKFISIRQYLIEYGLADTGKTPTTQDTIDIANGQVPTSLRSDTVHFNAATYQVVAQQVFNRLTELGWI